MKYGDLSLGQIEAIVNKLGGMEGVNRFLSDEITLKVIGPFELWKTIRVGCYKSINELRDALRAKNRDYGINAVDSILCSYSFVLSGHEEDIDLAFVPVSTLGFKESASYEHIYRRAKRYGLDACPCETAATLRLQYDDQPANEKIIVATRPILTKNSENKAVLNLLGLINDVENDYGKRLGWSSGDPDHKHGISEIFIFKIIRK